MNADYVIVGGGTAGCVLAKQLSDDAGCSVVLIEAGGRYRRLYLGTPLPSFRFLHRFMWAPETTPQVGLHHRRLRAPTGKVLGGGSSVNAMIYNRGHPSGYDAWRDAGNVGWGATDLAPYLQRVERTLPTALPRFRHPFSVSFVEALEELGYPANEGFCDDAQVGAGFFRVAQRRGQRSSAATAFLRPAHRRPNLEVRTGCLTTRVLLDGQRATGVEVLTDGRREVIHADREVIVSAGAVRTPQLLMLSGVGPARHLRHHAIPVVADLPGVGENLRDHLRLPVVYHAPGTSTKRVVLTGAVPYALSRRGILTSNDCEAGGFTTCGPHDGVPNVQYVTHWHSPAHPDAVDFEPCLVAARSVGTIRLRSASPCDQPIIDPRYLTDGDDVQVLLAAIEQCREIARTNAMTAARLGQELLPGRDFGSARELADYVRLNVDTCFHLAGTCRMGDDELAVVDDHLRVRGTDGLRVVDASIMPTLLNANTSGPTMAIALRAADLILRDAPQR
jgi:choline dehydrogenase